MQREQASEPINPQSFEQHTLIIAPHKDRLLLRERNLISLKLAGPRTG